MSTQEPDRLPSGKILVAVVATLAVFGVGIAVAVAGVAGQPLSAVPSPSGTIEHGLIRGDALGLRRPHSELDRYEWVDRDAGIARIPLERAIDVTLEQRR